MTERFDLAVVGAGFAGLACAEAAARRGLRVVVLERKRDPGAGVHTTGLLTREAVAALRAPARALGPRRDAIEVASRSGGSVRIEREDAGFLTTDTAALLRALAERAAAAGAEVRTGLGVQGVAEAGSPRPVVHAGAHRVTASLVVACDGALSRAARSAGLPAPRRLLSGAERHVELAPGHGLDERACLLLLDGEWAPGYAAWCVRGACGAWQVGVLGERRRGYRPDAALGAVLAWLARTRGARVAGVSEVRGGVVPAGGAVSRPWRGSVVLAGDAAGHVSALTAGGIGRAAHAGRVVGEGALAPGEPWRRELVRLGAACGGWRLVAAHALRAAVGAGAPLALALVRPAVGRAAATSLAFRPTSMPDGPPGHGAGALSRQ